MGVVRSVAEMTLLQAFRLPVIQVRGWPQEEGESRRMSTWGDGGVKPAPWAVERFGSKAGRLASAIPLQLARAHEQARAAHDWAGVRKRGPYGVTLAEAVRENLADTARELGEAVRTVRGYEYAVVNEHALFPYRYGDRPKPLELARLPRDASATRRRLLTGHGPEPDPGLFDIGEVSTTQEYEELHQTFEELGASTRVVCVFFTADRERGVHAVHWGVARLEPDRYFTWLHRQELPVAPRPLDGRPGGASAS